MRRAGLAAAALAAFLAGLLAARPKGEHRYWCVCRGCTARRVNAR